MLLLSSLHTFTVRSSIQSAIFVMFRFRLKNSLMSKQNLHVNGILQRMN